MAAPAAASGPETDPPPRDAAPPDQLQDADGPGVPGSAGALRHVMGQFASSVCVVTTVHRGVAQAMTATAIASVSLDPPLILVCVGKASRFHPAAVAAEAWAVSVLSAGQRTLAEHFADRTRDLRTQFDGVPHQTSPGAGSPVLDGALGWLECRTWARHDAGDHTIVVGRVIRASGLGPSDETGDLAPLVYHRAQYISTDRPVGPR